MTPRTPINLAPRHSSRTILGSSRTTKFQFKRRERDGSDGEEKPRRRVEKPERSAPQAAVAPQAAPAPPPPAPTEAFRTFPLGGNREMKFVLPSPFTMKDVRRVALHFATYAEDFDPDQPANAQVGLAVRHD